MNIDAEACAVRGEMTQTVSRMANGRRGFDAAEMELKNHRNDKLHTLARNPTIQLRTQSTLQDEQACNFNDRMGRPTQNA